MMAGGGGFFWPAPRPIPPAFWGGPVVGGRFLPGGVPVFSTVRALGRRGGGRGARALSLAMAFFAMEAISGSEARAQRKFIEGVFSRHVAPEVVGQILNDPTRMTSLEGERRVMTFLFTDVADFTTLSEK